MQTMEVDEEGNGIKAGKDAQCDTVERSVASKGSMKNNCWQPKDSIFGYHATFFMVSSLRRNNFIGTSASKGLLQSH
jgi:hypothetical protein